MFPSSSPATAAAPRFTTAAASLVQTLEHGGNEGKRKQRARVDGYISWHFCKSVHDIFDGTGRCGLKSLPFLAFFKNPLLEPIKNNGNKNVSCTIFFYKLFCK